MLWVAPSGAEWDEHKERQEKTTMNRKRMAAAIGAVMLAGGGVVWAATISNLSGQSCGDFTGTWHFVNNQTGGAGAGVLTATFLDAGVIVHGADTVNANNQHFTIVGPSGPLLGASTNLAGRLVLSDLTCVGTPPPCDEKDPKCEEPPK
jgi:hypothetical protein